MNLLIGTPNAVSLNRRVSMLVGRNPYERIRTTINNPGHFREYTTAELRAYGKAANFDMEGINLSDFYETSGWRKQLKKYAPTLRDCIHIVLQKNEQPDNLIPLTIW